MEKTITEKINALAVEIAALPHTFEAADKLGGASLLIALVRLRGRISAALRNLEAGPDARVANMALAAEMNAWNHAVTLAEHHDISDEE